MNNFDSFILKLLTALAAADLINFVTVTDADEHYKTYYTLENGHICRLKCGLKGYRYVNSWVEKEEVEKDSFLDTILISVNKIIESYGHND